MLKLLTTTLLLSSSLLAATSNEAMIKFLEKSFKKNPNIVSMKVSVVDKMPVEKMKGWEAFIINIKATVKAKPKNRKISQKKIWFSNGELITQDFVDMKSGKSLQDLVSPSLKPEHYKKENLIYGNVDAKHKIAIFSDPLCPFCKDFVPKAIKYIKSQPEKFALYYYHFALPALHPASVTLTKAAIAAELKGKKDVVLKLYKVVIKSSEKNVKKILAAFNKTMKTDIKPADLKTKEVLKHYRADLKVASDVMVQGTPTMFFDSKKDKTRSKYKKVK